MKYGTFSSCCICKWNYWIRFAIANSLKIWTDFQNGQILPGETKTKTFLEDRSKINLSMIKTYFKGKLKGLNIKIGV